MIYRVKEVVRILKDKHRETPDSTILLISHCGFLEYLLMILTGQHQLLLSNDWSASNNSLTILDILSGVNDKTKQPFVEVNVIAYNLQLIENTKTLFK